MTIFTTILLSLFITIGLMSVLKTLAVRASIVDVPNERKVHDRPIPRIGGISMAVGILVPVAFFGFLDRFAASLLTGSIILVVFGVLDDKYELRPVVKLIGQLAAAAAVIFYGGLVIRNLGDILPGNWMLPDWVAIPLTFLAVVGVTNAVNLSDGLDGLAGGIAMLGFIFIAYLAYRSGHPDLALVAAAAVGAIFGFLRFNTYPATVFMGDAGSQLLGFLGVCLALAITQDHTPLNRVLPLLLLGFPILDTITVMVERKKNGRPLFAADKNHFHHKLMRLGLYHTEAVAVIYLLQFVLVFYAYAFRFYSEWYLLGFYLVFCGTVLWGFHLADVKDWSLGKRDVFDNVIKGRLKVFKDRHALIKFCFHALEILVPGLMLATCLMAEDIPGYVGWTALLTALGICLVWWLKDRWLAGFLRFVLYMAIPYVVYMAGQGAHSWLSPRAVKAYNLAFGIVVFFAVLTLKFTHRRRGFRASPMDILIVIIALVVPNLPGIRDQIEHLGLLTAKIIALFFSCEVLIGELRGQLGALSVYTMLALAGIFYKSI